jgi:hypothetical protein
MYIVQSKNLEKTVFILYAQVRVLQTPAWAMLQVFCYTKKNFLLRQKNNALTWKRKQIA